MALFNVPTVYTVVFGARFDDFLILTITYRTDGGIAVSTQVVLNKDCREPDFISRKKSIWSAKELESIVEQINAWCDSLDFPRPNWKE